MCPACLAAAALIAAGVASTGGLAMITIKRFSVKNALDDNSALPSSERLGK